MNRRHVSHAFTLIELLVVIAIIAILAAILFPVFAQARAKARQTACLSNMKQIGLGMMMYVQDYDEKLPPFRQVPTGGDWWTARMLNWKDSILPYIKNGGRAYNGGAAYTQQGDGGIFQCPDNIAAWSTARAWGFGGTGNPGDESTRFARSYAVNKDAGVNETGQTIWPCVGDSPCGGGGIAAISQVADTIMVAESRLTFADVSAANVAYECQRGTGEPWGGTGFSCVKGHNGGFSNFVFFDGHAKAHRAVRTLQDDLWGCYRTYGTGTAFPQQGWAVQNANNIREWNPGI
ncbi:MAG: hypothetical protein OHK0029_41870 [Armatimonadaceae bacterium]